MLSTVRHLQFCGTPTSPRPFARQGELKRAPIAVFTASLLVSGLAAGTAVGEAPDAKSISDGLQQPRAIAAGRYLAPDGTLQPDIGILLQDGRIAAVVPQDQVQEAEGVVRWPNAVVSPGAIGLLSTPGAYRKVEESAFSIDPAVSAVEALDLRHPDFRRGCEAGITTALIPPSPQNLVSGAAAVVKMETPSRDSPVLRSAGLLVLSLGPAAWDSEREPTSRMGSVAMLRDLLDEARAGRGHSRLKDFAAGRLDAVVVCGELPDVTAAVRTLGGTPARFAIAYNGDDRNAVDELASARRTAILGPLGFDSSQRALMLPGELAKAGVAVAFAAPVPVQPADGLRLTASLAVRYGMDPSAARRAMTVEAAHAAGVADRVGAIRAGADADLVVFSDDPLRLDSRVLEVYVDGVRVFASDRARPQEGDGL